MTAPELQTPGRLLIRIACPRCNVVSGIEAEVTASLVETTDMDGDVEAALSPKFRAQKIAHVCNQLTLDRETGEVLS